MLSSLTLFQEQHECTSTLALGCNGGSILQNEACHLHIAVANRPDCLLLGYQASCERQRLHQVQGGQKQVRGPYLSQTLTPPTQQQTTTTRTLTPPSWCQPRHPARRGRSSRILQEGVSTCPQPWGRSGAGKGLAGGGGKKAFGKA
jgi:hypothetical protein